MLFLGELSAIFSSHVSFFLYDKNDLTPLQHAVSINDGTTRWSTKRAVIELPPAATRGAASWRRETKDAVEEGRTGETERFSVIT